MAQAEILYRDQQLLFPPSDDIEVLDPRWRADRRQAFSAGGVPETAMVLPYQDIEARIADVIRDQTVNDLEAWWSYARSGGPYSFAFDSTDKVLAALDDDVAAGTTGILLSSSAGIAPNRRYWIMHDLLGRNTSQNALSSAQSLCDDPADYAFLSSQPTPWADIPVTPPKVGSASVRTWAAPGYYMSMRASGPSVPEAGYLTFSIWVRGFTPPPRWKLRIIGNGVDASSARIAIQGGLGFRRYSLTAYFPNGASATTVSLETDQTWHNYLFITTDAWQVEAKQHATPWVQGTLGVDAKTVSTRGYAEIVEVQAVGTGFPRNRVSIKSPLKFPYSSRDAFRSLYYWERAVSLDADSPLRLKMLTSEFRHRFREVP